MHIEEECAHFKLVFIGLGDMGHIALLHTLVDIHRHHPAIVIIDNIKEFEHHLAPHSYGEELLQRLEDIKLPKIELTSYDELFDVGITHDLILSSQ